MGQSLTMSLPSGARAEIVVDLEAVRHNVRTLRELVAADGAELMTVVKADAYGHGLVPVARAAREAGASWLGVATADEALALRQAGDTGKLLCWLGVPGEPFARARGRRRRRHGVLPGRARRDRGRRGRGGSTRPTAAQGGHRVVARRRDDRRLAGAGGRCPRRRAGRSLAGHGHLVPFRLQRRARAIRRTTQQESVFRDALAVAAEAGLQPEVRHLANSAAAILRPSARFDLVRCGIASYGLDPAPGHTPDLGLVPAMTVRTALRWSSRSPPAPASPTATPGWPSSRHARSGWCPSGTATACRAMPAAWPTPGWAANGARSAGGSAWTSSSSISPVTPRCRGTRWSFRLRAQRRAHGPGLGGGLRDDLLRDRDPDRWPDATPDATAWTRRSSTMSRPRAFSGRRRGRGGRGCCRAAAEVYRRAASHRAPGCRRHHRAGLVAVTRR